ncbi:ATP-binding protein [Lysinibacillus sp. FSL K6-0057]|uniref:ATP-binding protein n=1 Tax=unclassified Lysinibacillus TaxID=2636778 RepID=UPI00315905B2
MYLSQIQNNELDKIVKNFEVAYRSYIAEKVFLSFTSELLFEQQINNLLSTTSQTSIIQTGKFESKLKKIKANKKDFYKSIQYSINCLNTKDYESGQDNSVLYVSEIVDLTLLLYNPLFLEIGQPFETIESFIYSSEKYKSIRNDLSHPASSKVLMKDAQEVLLFITQIMKVIKDKYFWYCDKKNIENYISDFFTIGKEQVFKIHNLNEIAWDTNTILFREPEIQELQEAILGKDEFYRRAGSLVVYGYGGVGKTSLILEFIRVLHRKAFDKELRVDLDFLLYFSNKKEELSINDSTGDLKINQLRCQIQNSNELKVNILNYLKLSAISEAGSTYRNGGIVVIDNFETFSEFDKQEVMNFIQQSPRNIQYILTSRNEESCEYKLNLKGFSEQNNGLGFIEKYAQIMGIDLEHISEEDKKSLLYESQGNTLIILLAMDRISSKKKTINEIIAELSTISTENTEIIAEFMYKNTFDQTIAELQERDLEAVEILRIIALYDEPIDIFSISKIADLKIKNVETTCVYLSTKLIVTKSAELYSMSEFATKFIFFNLLPNDVEKKKLELKIAEHKQEVKQNISFLEEKIEKFTDLKNIMADWKPTNYVDKIAITEVYAMYQQNKNNQSISMKKLEEIESKIHSIEVRTPHPYIRFQKARIFKMLMDERAKNQYEKLYCLNIIGESLERTIMTIKYKYPNIKSTKSYAAVLWIHALSLDDERGIEIGEVIKYLEEACLICERYNHKGDMYHKILMKLSTVNRKYSEQGGDRIYLENSKKCLEKILADSPRGKIKQSCNKKIKEIEDMLLTI